MESDLLSLTHKSVEEITERIGHHLNDKTRPEILGEKICRYHGSGTGKTLVKLCLLGDILRISTDTIYADGVVSQDEIELLYPLMREWAAMLPRYRSQYSPFADLQLEQAAEFLKFYADDGGVFGYSSSATQWAGLDICRNLNRVCGDESAIKQYEHLAVDVTLRLSAVDRIADKEREYLKQIQHIINEHRDIVIGQGPENNPLRATSRQADPLVTGPLNQQSPRVPARKSPKVSKKETVNQTRFEVYKKPRELSLEKIGDRYMTTLLGGGIINPFGPTLNVLALEGEIKPGCTAPIFHLNFNPFSQFVNEIGKANIGDTWILLEAIPQLFDASFGCCPTLLLPSKLLSHEDTVTTYARFFATFDDGVKVLNKVRRFPGDPWNRVKPDGDELTSIFEKRQVAQRDDAKQRKLTVKEARELSTNLLEPENLRSELKAFMFAWEGSIKFQGAGIMSQMAMPLTAFLRYYLMFALSCNMPDLLDK